MSGPRGYFAVGLVQPKTPENIGHVLRACGCFGAAFLGVEGVRYQKHHTDTQQAYRHMPLIQTDDIAELIPYDCLPIGVELVPDAGELPGFQHPERAFYIFGPEDGSIPPRVLERCKFKVSIPTARCLNLAMCANIVMYDRVSKRRRLP